MKTSIHRLALAAVTFATATLSSVNASDDHDHDHSPVAVPVAGSAAEAWHNAQNSVQAIAAAVPAKQQQVLHDEQEKLAGALRQLQERNAGAADNARLTGAINNAIAASERLHVASDAGDWPKVESALRTLQATMAMLEKQLPEEAKQFSGTPPPTIKVEIISPKGHAAGKSARTVLRLTDGKGQPVSPDALQVAHTEKLHLLIVDESLADYHHEHPTPTEKPGEYQFDFSPRHGGTYHVWADVVPTATGRQEYAKTTMTVEGAPAPPAKSINASAEAGGYRFDWRAENEQPLRVGQATLVKVQVTDKDQPFAKLEPVMGAFAHMVGFPADLGGVTHVHPMGKEPADPTERGGPELVFHVQPEKPGYHKFYVQTQIGGEAKFAAFGLNVEPGAAPAKGDGPFVCPMHPEVSQPTPGKCPKCGMDLVAK